MTQNQKNLLLIKLNLKNKILSEDESILEDIKGLNLEEIEDSDKTFIEDIIVNLIFDTNRKSDKLLNSVIKVLTFLNKDRIEFLMDRQKLDYSDKKQAKSFLNKYINKNIYKNEEAQYRYLDTLTNIAISIDDAKSIEILINKIQEL